MKKVYMLAFLVSSIIASEKSLARIIAISCATEGFGLDGTTETTIGQVVNMLGKKMKIPTGEVVLIWRCSRISEESHDKKIFDFIEGGKYVCLMRKRPGQNELEEV